MLRQQRTLDRKENAVRNKNFVFGFMFVLCTAASVYCGVKCVSYNFRTSGFFWHALVMGTLPVLINLEFFVLRELVNSILKTEGRLFEGVHHHPMVLTQLPCNWCDLCHKRIREEATCTIKESVRNRRVPCKDPWGSDLCHVWFRVEAPCAIKESVGTRPVP